MMTVDFVYWHFFLFNFQFVNVTTITLTTLETIFLREKCVLASPSTAPFLFATSSHPAFLAHHPNPYL